MEELERCVVHARKGGLYYVKITKNAKCDGCKACAFGRKNYVVTPAVGEDGYAVGDTVDIRMPQKNVKAPYVYLYLLPLLCLFIGLMIPYGHGELYMFIGGAIGLACSIPAVYAIEIAFRRRKKYLPVIVRKSAPPNESENKEKTQQTKP